MVLTNQLIYLVNVKTIRKIFSNYVCFSKNPNFSKFHSLLSPNLSTKNLGRMPMILNKDSRLFTAQFFDLLYSDDDFDDNEISCYLIKDKLQGAPQDLFLLWDGSELGNCQNTGFNLEANFYKKHPIYVSQFQLSSDCQGKNNICIMGL